MAMDKTKSRRAGEASLPKCEDGGKDLLFGAQYPNLEEFLRESRWSDGSRRDTGSMLIFLDDGRWKGMLRDRDARMVAFVSAVSFDNVLAALEQGLVDDSLDWRADKAVGNRKK